jgi:hypothetical protein
MSEEIINQDVDTGGEPDVSAVEAEARQQGWKPLEEYEGNPAHWRDAQEFLEFGQRMNPILRKNNEELKKQIQEIKGQFDQYKNTASEIIRMQKEQVKKEYDSQINFLKSQIKAARAAGDYDVAAEFEEQYDQLKENAPEFPSERPQAQTQPTLVSQDEYAVWAQENPWAEKDRGLSAAVTGLAIQYGNQGMRGTALLKAVEQEIKEQFPEKFASRKRANMVEAPSGGSGPRSTGKVSYERLPTDAKAQCDQFVRDKLGSREDYLKLYNA